MSQYRTSSQSNTVYSALPSHEDSFRLLRVLPSLISSSRVHCELMVTSIAGSSNQYIAGSYVWGPQIPLTTIRVNGIKFDVRSNLAHFLRACRLRRETFVMWIDAICINQDDPTERSNQVAVMDQIYSNAKAVHCWLGREDNIATALNTCGTVAVHELRPNIKSQLEPFMASLIQCEYWTRVWIVQEFVLASEVFLLAGPYKVPLQRISSLLSVMAFHESTASRITQLRHIRKQGLQFPGFQHLFETFCGMKCALPRDRLFALTGILDTDEAVLLRGLIDYELPIEKILHHLLKTGLIRDHAHFMEHFVAQVVESEHYRNMKEPLDIKFTPCSHIAQHPTEDCPGGFSWHFHPHLAAHIDDDAWSKGVRISCQWSQYLSRSYDMLQLLREPFYADLLCVTLLIPTCTQDCNPLCRGHVIAGVALVRRFWYQPTVGVDRTAQAPTLGWAQTLEGGPIEYPGWSDTPQAEHSTWQSMWADATRTISEMLLSSTTVTRASNSECYLKADLETFMQLCRAATIMNWAYKHPNSGLKPWRNRHEEVEGR